MELIFVLIVCAVIGAMILSPYNKAGLGCVAGALLGPLGIVAALIEKGRLKSVEDKAHHEEQMRALTVRRSFDDEIDDQRRACPSCAEQIKMAAKVCRFCGRDVVSAESLGR